MKASIILATLLFIALISLLKVQSPNFTSSTGKALEKAILSVSCFILITFCLKPDLSTYLANSLGIGRGTDLILYIFGIFTFYSIVRLYKEIKILNSKVSTLIIELSLLTNRVKS